MITEMIRDVLNKFFGRTSKELVKVFTIQLLIVLFGFLTNILIARFFGKESLGVFTYFFGLVGLLAIISLFGMQSSIVTIVKRNKNLAGDVIRKSFLLSIPFAFITTYLAIFLTDHFSLNPNYSYFKFMIYLYVVVQGFYALFSNYLRAFDKFTLSNIFNLLFRVAFIVFVFVSYYYDSFYLLLLSMTLAMLVNFPYLLYKFFSFLPAVKEKILTFELLRISFAFLLQSVALYSMLQVDRLTINYVLSFSSLGDYAAYSSVINIIRLAAAVFPIVLTPLAVSTKFQIRSSFKKIMIVLIPFATFVYFSSWFLVPFLFGTEFIVDYYVLLVMTISASLLVIYSYFNSIYLGEGELDKQQMRVVIVDAILSVFVNLFLNVILLKKYGLIGAPIATVVTIIIKILVVTYGIKKMRSR